MSITVTVDFRKIDRLQEAVAASSAVNGVILGAWALIFNAFTRDRFDILSKHGTVDGYAWDALKESTEAARRPGKPPKKGKKKKKPSILRDRGLLFAAIRPGTGGGIMQKHIGLMVLTIYLDGGEAQPGGATLSEIAKFHQEGYAPHNLPSRTIIIVPPERTLNLMYNVAKKIVAKTLQDRLNER